MQIFTVFIDNIREGVFHRVLKKMTSMARILKYYMFSTYLTISVQFL